jgi:hypothetical protein
VIGCGDAHEVDGLVGQDLAEIAHTLGLPLGHLDRQAQVAIEEIANGLDQDLLWRRLQAIPAFTVAAGTRAFYALYGESQRKARSGDKTPGYVFTMQHIQALLPEAHFIHVIRDPRDTAMSWRKTWFAPSQDYATLGSFWRQNVEVGRRAAPSLRHYQEIRFEDLVLRPEAELRRLCSYLSLAYQPAMWIPARAGRSGWPGCRAVRTSTAG